MNHESNQYHLSLLEETIEGFQKALLTLEGLLYVTGKIEELLNALKEVDSLWKEKFRTACWELEYISSMMMDEETEEFTDEDREILNQSFSTMKEMVNDPKFAR